MPVGGGIGLGEVWAGISVKLDNLFRGVAQAQQAITRLDQQMQRSTQNVSRSFNTMGVKLDNLFRGVAQAQQAITRLDQQMQRSTQNVSRSFNTMGVNVQRALTAALSVVAVQRMSQALDGLAKTAFQAQTGLVVFARQVQRTGQDLDAAMNRIRGLSDLLRVPQEVLADNAAELIRYGYSVEQIVRIFEGAVASGLRIGRSTTDSIRNVTEALISERSVMLNVIGIVENLDAAMRNYARTQGVAVDQLTRAQRAEAAYQMIVRATAAEVEDLPLLLSQYGGAVAEAGMQSYNLRRALGDAVLPMVTQVRRSWNQLLNTLARLAQTREVRDLMNDLGRILRFVVDRVADLVDWMARYRRIVFAVAQAAIPALVLAITRELLPALTRLATALNTTIGRYTALFFAIIAAGAALYQLGRGLLEGKSLMESVEDTWNRFLRLFQEGPLALFQPGEPPDVGPSIPGIDSTVEDLAGRIAEKFETWDEHLQRVRLATGDVTTDLQAQERVLTQLLEAIRSGEAAFERVGFADLILGSGAVTEESIRLLYARREILAVERQIAELAARHAAAQDAREKAILADQIAELQAKRAEMLAQNQQVEMLVIERLLDVQGQLNRSAEYALELAQRLNQEIEEGQRARLSDFQRQIAEIEAWERQATAAIWALTDEQAKALASRVAGTTGIPLEQLLVDPLRVRQELVNQIEEEGRAQRAAAELDHREAMAERTLQIALDLAERLDLIDGESLERRRHLLDRALEEMRQGGLRETEAFRQAELEKLRVQKQINEERLAAEEEFNERLRALQQRINRRRNREDADLDANTRRFKEEQERALAERIAAAWSRTYRTLAETIGGDLARAVQTFIDAWAEFDVAAKLRQALPWLESLERALARGGAAVGQWLSSVVGDVGAVIRRSAQDEGIGGTVARGLLTLGNVATQVAGAFGAMLGPLLALVVTLVQASPQFEQFMAALEPVFTQLAALFGMLIQPLIPLVDVLANALGPLFQSLAPLFATLAQILASGLSVGLQMLGQVFQFLRPILDAFVGFLQTFIIPVFNVLGELLEGLWNGLAVVVNAIIDAINFLYPFGDLIKTKMGQVNFEPIDTGTLPAPGTGGTPATGGAAGTQISQITGPTRDLLVELLRPLRAMNELPALFANLQRIAQQILDALVAALSSSAPGLALTAATLEAQEVTMYVARSVINVDVAETLSVSEARQVTIVDRSGRALFGGMWGMRTVGA